MITPSMQPFWKPYFDREPHKEIDDKRAVMSIVGSLLATHFDAIDDVSLELFPYIVDDQNCIACKQNVSLKAANIYNSPFCCSCMSPIALETYHMRSKNFFRIALLISDICIECSCAEHKLCAGWLIFYKCFLETAHLASKSNTIKWVSQMRQLCTAMNVAQYIYCTDCGNWQARYLRNKLFKGCQIVDGDSQKNFYEYLHHFFCKISEDDIREMITAGMFKFQEKHTNPSEDLCLYQYFCDRFSKITDDTFRAAITTDSRLSLSGDTTEIFGRLCSIIKHFEKFYDSFVCYFWGHMLSGKVVCKYDIIYKIISANKNTNNLTKS